MSVASPFTLWSRRHTGSIAWPRFRATARVLWATALVVVGVILLRRLSTLGDWRAAWSKSLALGSPALLLLALPAVGHFVKMLGWRNLLPRGEQPSLGQGYATFVAAQAVNELGFSVLGEPLKVMAVPRAVRGAAWRAVLADNLAALAALAAVIATLLIGAATAMASVLATLVLLRLLLGERERRWLFAFGAHYLGKLWLVVEIALGLHLLGEPSLAPAAALSLAWLGAAAVGAPVPGQLGVVEAALVQSGTTLGVAASSLLALALIRRVRGLVWLFLGLLLAARIVHRKRLGDSDVSTTIA
jgi:hypothetical protein